MDVFEVESPLSLPRTAGERRISCAGWCPTPPCVSVDRSAVPLRSDNSKVRLRNPRRRTTAGVRAGWGSMRALRHLGATTATVPVRVARQPGRRTPGELALRYSGLRRRSIDL